MPLKKVTAGETVTVASSVELTRALKSGASTILLAPGHYDPIKMNRVRGPLTLRALDPQDRPRLHALSLTNSEKVTFRHLIFDYVFPTGGATLWESPFRLEKTRSITFDQVLFDGALHQGSGSIDDGFPTGRALVVVESEKLRLQNSELRNFWFGLILGRGKDIQIINNKIHSMRSDGIQLSQVRNLLVEGNFFHDFRQPVKSDDHPDFFQIFSANAKTASTDITVRGNIFNSGYGRFTQTIFFRNEQVDSGKAGTDMFYRNVLIENNVIINAHLHGITVGETKGLTIRNNTLIRNRRSEGRNFSDELASPRITVAAPSRNVRIENNLAYHIPPPQGPDWSVKNNLIIQDVGRGLPGHYSQIFEAPGGSDPHNLAAYHYRQGGPVAGTGIGAPQLDPGR